MSHSNIRELKPESVTITVRSSSMTHQIILLNLFIVITLVFSVAAVADNSMNSSVKDSETNHDRPALIDWSAKMSIELDKKMSGKLQTIILQAEESRLLGTGSTQFAADERTGSQPEVGQNEPEVFSNTP